VNKGVYIMGIIIELNDKQYQWLKEMSTITGKSEDVIIRDALDSKIMSSKFDNRRFIVKETNKDNISDLTIEVDSDNVTKLSDSNKNIQEIVRGMIQYGDMYEVVDIKGYTKKRMSAMQYILEYCNELWHSKSFPGNLTLIDCRETKW
jgi:hypothetical protein